MSKKTQPKENTEKKFKCFIKFMEYLNGISYQEGLKIIRTHKKFEEAPKSTFEDYNGFFAISAYGETARAVREICAELGLHPITMVVGDKVNSYSTGIGIANREYFMLCKSDKQAYCEE